MYINVYINNVLLVNSFGQLLEHVASYPGVLVKSRTPGDYCLRMCVIIETC